MPDPVPFQSSFFSVVQVDDIHIATVNRDQLTDDDNMEQFGQDFHLLIEKHEIKKFALVLTRVRYMTSSAIGKLITLHRKLNRSDGMLVLCELTPDVASTLDTARLLTYFTSCPDLAAAIAKLQS